jgi:hypothetical protein
MKNQLTMRRAVAAMLCVTLSTASPLTAATPWPVQERGQRLPTPADDVALGAHGLLEGSVLDRSGAGVTGMRVTMIQRGEQVASVVTDAGGSFRIHGVPAGSYTLAVAGVHHSYRLWQQGTEPSRAMRKVLIVTEGPVVRGQCPPGTVFVGNPCNRHRHVRRSLYDWFEQHPVLGYTFVTAAIVVPIVVVSENRDRDG